ncbi:hypothetical protein ACPA9J_32765 [Pseudomonas aeruginosa]
MVGKGAEDGRVRRPEQHARTRQVQPRPDQAGARRQARPGDRPRRRRSETTIEVLGRRKKNNPVLIGEPGVGKTAIVEGLAQRMVAG